MRMLETVDSEEVKPGQPNFKKETSNRNLNLLIFLITLNVNQDLEKATLEGSVNYRSKYFTSFLHTDISIYFWLKILTTIQISLDWGASFNSQSKINLHNNPVKHIYFNELCQLVVWHKRGSIIGRYFFTEIN